MEAENQETERNNDERMGILKTVMYHCIEINNCKNKYLLSLFFFSATLS